jgi:dTDP-6-deoxy-L-talose 4-dehydrogenase (NAD+)
MKHILVTGAGGYIGQKVVSSLIDLGAQVTAVDFRTDTIDTRATALAYDIFSPDSDILEKTGHLDACLHLAWQNGFVHNAPTHLEQLNAHYSFLSNLVKAGLPQLAVMGTMHEIGYYEGMIDESTPTNPVSFYGIAKNALRQSLTVLNQAVPFKLQWLRGFYILGNDRSNKSVFSKILMSEEQGCEIFAFNSGTNEYDFITVDNLALEIALTLLQDDVTGIINCCSGKPMPLRTMVEGFIKDNNLMIRLEFGAYPDRPYDSPLIYGSPEKIQKIIKAADTLSNAGLERSRKDLLSSWEERE